MTTPENEFPQAINVDDTDLDAHAGRRIRALRLARGMSLKEVAERANLSIGYISQCERGLSSISLRVLGVLSEVFSVSIANFFPEGSIDPPPEQSPILRKAQRPALMFWGTGISKEILTPPRPCQDAELVTYMMCLEPKGHSGDETFTHDGMEAGFILEGSLQIQIGEETFMLEEGDGFRFPSSVPHRFANISNKLTRVMWVNYKNS